MAVRKRFSVDSPLNTLKYFIEGECNWPGGQGVSHAPRFGVIWRVFPGHLTLRITCRIAFRCGQVVT
jgi:hypothetical protein